MRLIADANVFVGELLRRRGRELFRDGRLDLYVAQAVDEEARHELVKRVAKIISGEFMSRETAEDIHARALAAISEIAVVPESVYSEHLERAAYRVPRDPDDVPTVALALAMGGDEGRCGIWTNDGDFLGCGVPTWTTDTLRAHLEHDHRRQP